MIIELLILNGLRSLTWFNQKICVYETEIVNKHGLNRPQFKSKINLIT